MSPTDKEVAVGTSDVVTIDELERRQPWLAHALCEAWGQGMRNYVAFKRRIEGYVGWQAKTDDPVLQSEQAYVVALDELTNALHKIGERRVFRIRPKQSAYSRPWPGRIEPDVATVHYSKLNGDKTYECWQGFSLNFQVDCITRSLGLDHRQCGWRNFEATTKQEKFLRGRGQWYEGMQRGVASDAIIELFLHDRWMRTAVFGPPFRGLGVPEADEAPKIG